MWTVESSSNLVTRGSKFDWISRKLRHVKLECLSRQSDGHCRFKTGKQRQAPTEKPEVGLYGRSAPQMRMAGTDSRLKRRLIRKRMTADDGMENFLLFVVSSSFCTLVVSVVLLLRPLLGLP